MKLPWMFQFGVFQEFIDINVDLSNHSRFRRSFIHVEEKFQSLELVDTGEIKGTIIIRPHCLHYESILQRADMMCSRTTHSPLPDPDLVFNNLQDIGLGCYGS